MRLIDADALIDELGISDEDIVFKEILEDAPTVDAVPHWIPCEERLPEKDGEYLCCYGRHIHIGQMIDGHFRHYGECADHLITAWMPLPKPYKRGGEEDEEV